MDLNIGILCGLAVLVVAIVVFVICLKKSSNGKAKATEFLEGLANEIISVITTTIKTIDPKSYTDLEEFEAAVLENIYNDTWDYVYAKISEEYSDNALVTLIMKHLDKSFVVEFVNDLISSNNVMDTISARFLEYKVDADETVEEDEALAKKYADQTEYVEESKSEDLPVAEEVSVSEEDAAKLNPQVDEEEAYDVQDDSMELVTDHREIITTQDRNGNTLYYEVNSEGKKTRVSKAYALKNM